MWVVLKLKKTNHDIRNRVAAYLFHKDISSVISKGRNGSNARNAFVGCIEPVGLRKATLCARCVAKM